MDRSTGVVPVAVRTADIELSGLQVAPASASGPVRGLIVALHGGAYSAGYWDCPADGASLLALGASLGYHVLALDRPGYGASHSFDPRRLGLDSQVELMFDAIEAWTTANRCSGPIYVIGHSMGGIFGLLMAAHPRGRMLGGVDVLGVPMRFANSDAGNEVQSWAGAGAHLPLLTDELRRSLVMGPPGTWSAEADAFDATLVRPMPRQEYTEAMTMPERWSQIMPTIRLPVQFTVAEFDALQETGPAILELVRGRLSGSRHLVTNLQRASGHNASTHRIARSYHLRAIAFFDECRALAAP